MLMKIVGSRYASSSRSLGHSWSLDSFQPAARRSCTSGLHSPPTKGGHCITLYKFHEEGANVTSRLGSKGKV